MPINLPEGIGQLWESFFGILGGSEPLPGASGGGPKGSRKLFGTHREAIGHLWEFAGANLRLLVFENPYENVNMLINTMFWRPGCLKTLVESA